VLKSMSAGIVDMVLTSPPYWQKGDNGVEGQIGVEADFKDYIARLLQVFGEVKRILKPTGTCWVVIGDTYCGSGGAGGDQIGAIPWYAYVRIFALSMLTSHFRVSTF
jgi:DNA modification methylase